MICRLGVIYMSDKKTIDFNQFKKNKETDEFWENFVSNDKENDTDIKQNKKNLSEVLASELISYGVDKDKINLILADGENTKALEIWCNSEGYIKTAFKEI